MSHFQNEYDVPDVTVQDKVRFMHAHDAAKHGLHEKHNLTPDEYVDRKINSLSNVEFLELLSNAIEERLQEKADEL